MRTEQKRAAKASQKLYQEAIDLPNIIQRLIIITALTAILVFIVWSRDGVGTTATMMIALFCITVILFFVHRSGRENTAGLSLFAIIALIINFLSYSADGIYNLPHIFYPILLIFSGILFGRAMIPQVTALILVLQTLLFILDRNGMIVPFDGKVIWQADYFAISTIILLATAALLSISLKTVEENLMKIALSEKIIKESYELTLEGWAKALELSGREPEGHSKRVLELVTAFADDLRFDEEKKAQLRHGALLHDIGKMGISDSILSKPGPLNDEEQALTKEHTLHAQKMLADIAYLESLTDIPAYHHEQWDGNGYPKGLKEEEIPYAARIFSLIDNWVSLTSHQVYRPAWSDQKTMQYIEAQAGKKFDRKITNDFLKFLQKEQRRRYE